MKRIKTKNRVKQGKDGILYFVSREILKFNQLGGKFVAIVREQIFNIKETEGEEPVITVIEELPSVASYFTNEEVNGLFTQIEKPIEVGDDFVEKFNEMQVDALLYDTINQTELGRYGTKEWEKY